jgi:hypothetical protein
MAALLPRRSRINTLLELRRLVEGAQEDLARARHELLDVERHARLARLYVGTGETYLETIVEIYNRVAVEIEPAPPARR